MLASNRATRISAAGMACPWSFYVFARTGGGVRPMRVAINVESRDETRLFAGGSAPEGPGDHSPRLQWVCGDHLLEALKGAAQLLLEASDHPIRPVAPPAPIRGGREFVVSPFQGSSCSTSFPTAEAVGYDLWPLRGPDDRRCRPLHSQGCHLANVETPAGTPWCAPTPSNRPSPPVCRGTACRARYH